MTGCSPDTVLRFDTNKNEFRLYPLDVKEPTILFIDAEGNSVTETLRGTRTTETTETTTNN